MLLAKIADFLLTIPPWVVVFPDEKGIFLRGGKYKRTLSAGFYFKYPVYDHIRKLNVKEQVVDLPSQSVMTLDGKILALDGTIKYEIKNAKQALLNVFDYDASIQNLTMGLIAEYVSQVRTVKCKDVCSEVLAELNQATEQWGIEVLDFWLTTYAEHKVYRILGSSDRNILVTDE